MGGMSVMRETVASLVADGVLERVGSDYVDRAGRMYKRVVSYGKRGNAIERWKRDGDECLYRSLSACFNGIRR